MGELVDKKISVSIDGRRLFSFKSLKLHQPINEHHRFELLIDLETGGNRYVHNLKDSAEWLGKKISVHMKKPFLGVVTNVSLHRKNSDYGYILVSGYSTTYLLETGRNCHSWNDRSLGDIVNELCSNAGVRAQVNPEHTASLGYICQYNESDFMFIRRLACQYNEWLYYNGTELVFGRPKRPAPVSLEFGTSLSSLDIGVQTLARPAKVFSYLSMNDQRIAENTPNKPAGQDMLGYKAFQASMEMFKKPAYQYAQSRVRYMQEMEMYVRKKQEAETAESHYVIGTSENTELTVGCAVKLTSSFLERRRSITSESLGEFIIIEISHTVGEASYYVNKFKAIPAVTHTLPAPDIAMPMAETQMARIVNNTDPRGKGRVQVQMNWQTEGMHTDWIRVMTPDGGSSDDVKSNRGFVFIPEVGDQVLVGFRYNDPNRPYVMGSLFNGTTGGGGGQGNKCKSITTRSGSTLMLDDALGSVHLSDPGNSKLDMDGSGNATIDSAETIKLVCGEASLELRKDGTILINGKQIEVGATDSVDIGVGSDGDASSGIGMTKEELQATSQKMVINGSSSLNVGSSDGTTTLAAKGDVTVGGSKVSLN